MKKHYIATLCLALTAISCTTASGDPNNAGTGALIGGGSGMVIGGAVGGWQGAAIGGAAGALLGAGIGSMMDANGNKHEIKLQTLCEWRSQGMSEMEITSKLGKANLKPLSSEQIQYLKECGFSNEFIHWWQGQANVGS